MQGLDDEFRGFVQSESRPVQYQVVVQRVGNVLVEMVLDELDAFTVLRVDVCSRGGGGHPLIVAHKRDPVFARGCDADT